MDRKWVRVHRVEITAANFIAAAQEIVESFRQVAAAVAGPDGPLHRYCHGLVVDVRGSATSGGEGANEWDVPDFMNWIINSLTWERYDGYFCQSLTGMEVLALNGAEGIIGSMEKMPVFVTTPDPQTQGPQPWYGRVVLPYTLHEFAQGNVANVHQGDSPFPCALLGSSGVVRHAAGGTLPASFGTWTLNGSVTVSWYALILETQDVWLARPTGYRRYTSAEDPCQLPVPWCKLPTLFAMALKDNDPVVVATSDQIRPQIEVDGAMLTSELSALELQAALGMMRQDGALLSPLVLGGRALGLLEPHEADRWIEFPAGSSWRVLNVGGPQGAQVRYLYRQLEERSRGLLSKQLANMGIDPSRITDERLSINSNPLTGVTITERERLGIPIRLDQSRFV